MGNSISIKTKTALATAVFLWASAFVAIRAGLHSYSPAGLALLRYLVASFCMTLVYFRIPQAERMRLKDKIALISVGALGIGFYNITLNYGELSISAGMASFIISQAPIITTIFAVLFLGEHLNRIRLLGFIISILGVTFITVGEKGGFKWDASITSILLATIAGSSYSILQKPFLKKYHAIVATTYAIWGGTLFLCMYFPALTHDILHASLPATLTALYLGVFPAAIGYIAWNYALAEIPASRAVSFLYFTPFLAMLIGWIWLGEIPAGVSVAGGMLAIVGVWLVNQSYRDERTQQEVAPKPLGATNS